MIPEAVVPDREVFLVVIIRPGFGQTAVGDDPLRRRRGRQVLRSLDRISWSHRGQLVDTSEGWVEVARLQEGVAVVLGGHPSYRITDVSVPS